MVREKSYSEVTDVNVVDVLECPCCAAEIELFPNYSPWCEQCDWNLQPSRKLQPSTPKLPLFERINQYSVTKLFANAMRQSRLAPQLSLAQVGAFALATVTYVLIGAIAFRLGEVALISEYAVWLRIIAGIGAAWSVWSIVPRFESIPSSALRASEKDFPALNDVVQWVANAVGVEKPLILMTDHFAANFGRIGIQRKPVLCLGHPFLSILDRDELVSLIAHELSHSKDGAWTRTPFVRTALLALDSWHKLLRADRFWNVPNQFLQALLTPFYLIFLVLGSPIRLLRFLLDICCYRDKQQAEYVADAYSLAFTTGKQAVSLLKKSFYGHLGALQEAYNEAPPAHKYMHLRQQLEKIPAREIERVWRIAQRSKQSLFSTHPSPSYRLAFLSKERETNVHLRIESALYFDLHRELREYPMHIQMQRAAVDQPVLVPQSAGLAQNVAV